MGKGCVYRKLLRRSCSKKQICDSINNKQGLKFSGICTVIHLSSKVEKLEKTHCNVLIKSSYLKPSVTLTEQI